MPKPPSRFSFRPFFGAIIGAILLLLFAGCGNSGSSSTPPVTIVATPSISIPTGTYSGPQQVTLSDTTQGSSIYYTANGTVPTTSSTLYQGPISIAVSSTLETIAVLNGVQSAVAVATLTITAPAQAKMLAFKQQPTTVAAGATFSPAVQVEVEDSSGNLFASATNPVTIALVGGSGLSGTLTETPQNGIATFSDLRISNAGSGYTLVASSPGLVSATSTSFAVSALTSNGTTILESAPASITAFPGGTFEITYNWLAVPVAVQASVFVNFVDSTGAIEAQDNLQPPVPTSQWKGPLSYTHTLTVPSAATAGVYSIVVGLQSTSGNLSLMAGAGVTSLPGAEYQIGTLTLAPTCSIATFGATGDGVTDNSMAIQNAFNYAATNQCIALIPAGTFAYSGNLNAAGIAVTGTGAASILKPLSVANEAIILSGNGGSITNLAMISAATSRLSTPQSGMIYANGAQNYYVENVLINNSASTGIFSGASHDGYVLNNTIENTLADSVSQGDASYEITISGNRILNSGDDGISNNSYIGDPGVVHGITVQGNTVLKNVGGRGLEVSGGSDITFMGNYVDNLDGFSDMYVASESESETQSVANVIVSGNSFLDGGPNQGSAIVYNSQGGATTITAVTIDGNQFVNPKLTALQYAGDGSESGLFVNSNTDYSNGQFSTSSNPNANPTEAGNQVLAPSAYTTPLVPAGGGCNFSGC